MSNLGARTDHFGLATADLVLIESSEDPVAQNRVDAPDENGDIAASAYHGNSTQDMREVSCTYSLKSGTLNLNTIKMGVLAAAPTVARNSIEVSTVNGSECPKFVLSGRKNIITPIAPTGKLNSFVLPSVEISAVKAAQQLLFATGAGCRLTSSRISASVELSEQQDGVGEPVAHGVSGGTGEISADFVRITAAPSWTVNAGSPNEAFGITETKAPGTAEGQATWHTGTGSAAFTVLRESAE